MNIEQLTKSQLVLLALLLSFVTSIATGIVTVSLMDQAPPVIAQTVNRVVERTIETVAPASQTAASATVRERTVVIRESELISQAVTNVSPSIVRIYTNSSDTATFLGLGIVLGTDGTIVSDSSMFGTTSEEAIVALPDGSRVSVSVTSLDATTGLAFLQATSTDEAHITWKPAVIAGSNPILGQTVIALSGRTVVRIEYGIVTALIPGEKESATDSTIDTNISPDSVIAGSPLVNTNGEIVGISTSVSRTSSPKGFLASSALIRQSASDTQEPPKASE